MKMRDKHVYEGGSSRSIGHLGCYDGRGDGREKNDDSCAMESGDESASGILRGPSGDRISVYAHGESMLGGGGGGRGGLKCRKRCFAGGWRRG